MHLGPQHYESWHNELPDDPIEAMHKAREQSVLDGEMRDPQNYLD